MSLHVRGPLSQNVKLDDERDIATIYGVKVSGELLRTLGEPTPAGIWFRVVKVEDGQSTIEQRRDARPEDAPPGWTAFSHPAEQRVGLCHADGLWWEGPNRTWYCGTCHPAPWLGYGKRHEIDRTP
jgi:hypothetical protein